MHFDLTWKVSDGHNSSTRWYFLVYQHSRCFFSLVWQLVVEIRLCFDINKQTKTPTDIIGFSSDTFESWIKQTEVEQWRVISFHQSGTLANWLYFSLVLGFHLCFSTERCVWSWAVVWVWIFAVSSGGTVTQLWCRLSILGFSLNEALLQRTAC